MKFANICLSSHLYVCGYCKNHYFECLELEELIHHGLTCPCYGPKHYIPVSFHKCKGPGCGYVTTLFLRCFDIVIVTKAVCSNRLQTKYTQCGR